MTDDHARARRTTIETERDFTFAPAVTPDVLSEFQKPGLIEWKSPEFEMVHNELKRFAAHHTKQRGYASADIHEYNGYDFLAPYLLVLDVQPHPLDFTYSYVGSHVESGNERKILGFGINELRMRNRRKYGLCGHQAEMYCLFMDTLMFNEVFATSRNMTVCVDDKTDLHRTKDIDIAAVRASSHGLFPDKIISVAMISDTVNN